MKRKSCKKYFKPIIGITVELIGHRVNRNYREYNVDQDYVKAIEKAGGVALLLPISINKSIINKYVSTIDGLLISGGADIHPKMYGEKMISRERKVSPERIKHEKILIKRMLKLKKHIFGICYGMQLLNILFGGTLYQDIRKQKNSRVFHRSDRFQKHIVNIKRGSILQKITKKRMFYVLSEHHQGIKILGKGLNVIATAKDGIIEAIECGKMVLGVQWHPERQTKSKDQLGIFKYFVRLCRRKKRKNCVNITKIKSI